MFLKKTFPTLLTGKVKYFYSVVGDVSHMPESIHRNLPDGTLELIFNLADPVLESADGLSWAPGPVSAVTGLYHDKRFTRYTGKIHLVGAVFLPGYAARFVNDRLAYFSQCLFSAHGVFGNTINSIRDHLYDVDTEEQRHRLLEKYLYNHFKGIRNEYEVTRITNSVHLILKHNGNIGIPLLYKSACMSERNFRRKFQDLVGLSAKRYASIIRVKSFVKTHKLKGTSYMDLAYDLGYTDQSHLIKEFRNIAGVSPTEFFNKLNPVDCLYIHSPQQ